MENHDFHPVPTFGCRVIGKSDFFVPIFCWFASHGPSTRNARVRGWIIEFYPLFGNSKHECFWESEKNGFLLPFSPLRHGHFILHFLFRWLTNVEGNRATHVRDDALISIWPKKNWKQINFGLFVDPEIRFSHIIESFKTTRNTKNPYAMAVVVLSRP